MKVEIKRSPNPEKKLVAIFYDDDEKVKVIAPAMLGRSLDCVKVKTTHFGSKGMSDYTQHKDPIRKERYMDRHRRNENWNDYMTAGSLSRWILWNKTSLQASIRDYKSRFHLK